MSENKRIKNFFLFAQVTGIFLVWVFVISFGAIIVRLLLLSMELKDAPGFSVVISLIAIPIFGLLAGVLTYVFVGLRKNRMID
jgi:hypothetical protein